MSSDEDTLQKRVKDLKVSVKSDINILLLGETGVGKSTFINSVANYLTYTDLKRAKRETLITLIPSKCKVMDKDGEYHIIQIGSAQDKNEFLDVGESATQDVKTYVFPIWDGNVKVRLIDTPGMGDTRGIDQDNTNCENILSYIGQLHELHAICLLFKPTNARLTNLFEYCMSQILSRLDKSASKNIIFVFTNTRGSDYGPGETLPLLQRVIQNIKERPPYVDIPLNRNIFCFDNEAFRYLAAVKQGIEFDATVKERNLESWKKSVDQCSSLIKYIVGDAQNRPLTPHFIKHTNAINEARRMIVHLSKPLAEITQLIHDNLRALERHRANLNLDANSLERLKSKLYMPVITLDVTKLSEPVTVCTHIECAEMYKVGDLDKWYYKTRCHNPCYLRNVPKELIGSPELVRCAAMNPLTQHCNKCSHIFSVHMHVYYMTETKEDKIIDPNIQSNIDTKEKILYNAKKLISDIFTRQNELEREHDIIVKASARFAHFLQNNAITPFSDSYKEYIEYLIVQERSHPVADMEVLKHLQKLLKEYMEAKNIFDEALQAHKKIDKSEPYITPQKIHDSIQELYKLKHNGKKIKELYECQKKSRSKEHDNKTEYIHKVANPSTCQNIYYKIFLLPPKEKNDGKTEKKTKKNDQQKKPEPNKKKKNTEGQNYAKTDNRQQRGRNRSPPPAYEDVRRPFPSTSRPRQPRYPHRPPPQSPGMYPPGPYNYGPHPPNPGPNPYPQPPAGPHEYYSGYEPRPRERSRQRNDNTTFQVKVILDKAGQNSSKREYSSADPYSASGPYGGGTDPHRDPYSASGPYGREADPHRSYTTSYPPAPYPVYGQPPTPPVYGGPPQPQYHQGYSQHHSGGPNQYPNFDTRGQHHGPNEYEQRPREHQYNQNARGRGGHRGRGRGGVTSNSKFKNYRKKKNETANPDSDDSDISVASSQRQKCDEFDTNTFDIGTTVGTADWKNMITISVSFLALYVAVKVGLMVYKN